ncbi:O-antigen ligase family protein [Alicyclobacillus tolerans]|uniref:O-antigen ligase family protein n=1 Tax=Alicyclobacillus tolerans TaxID=90970 RepID=UPI001F48DC1F|nr:O-antigen ligase family protein [Alicyclobacillus tolerans]MCF8564914.1 O-antigen ligase family protein [Alicyclobacillus tolerans]
MRVTAFKTIHFSSKVSVDNSRWVKWPVYALTAFPLIDFGLRHTVAPIGSVWDKVVLLLLMGAASIRYWSGTKTVPITWSRFAIYFCLFGLALVFANFTHPLLTIAGYRIDVYYIFFGLLIPFVVEAKDVPKLLYSAALIAILIGIDGVFQYIVKTPIPKAWVDPGEHLRTRVFSVLVSCNELGAYMALMIPLIGGLMLYDTDRWRKWLLGLGLVPCTATLLFTFSRAAWFSLGLAIVVVAIAFERRLLIGLALLFAAAFLIPGMQHRILDVFSPLYWMKSAHGGRVARWHQAFSAMQSDPLFGVGPGHYGGAMAVLYHFSMYSDNYYAKTLGETGIVGLTLFFVMHIKLMQDLWARVTNASGGKKMVFLGGLAGLLSVLIHSGFENVFEYAPMSLCYFFVVSLLLVWGHIEMGDGPVRALDRGLVVRNWLLTGFWALCVNEVNIWLIKPMVLHFAVLGVLAVMAMSALWLVSIPPGYRKTWVELTIFDLLVGQVLSYAFVLHWHFVVHTVLAVVGLLALSWIVIKMRMSRLLVSGLVAIGVVLVAEGFPVTSTWGLDSPFTLAAFALLGASIVAGFALRNRAIA